MRSKDDLLSFVLIGMAGIIVGAMLSLLTRPVAPIHPCEIDEVVRAKTYELCATSVNGCQISGEEYFKALEVRRRNPACF